MLHVTREVGDNIFVFDDEDGSLDFVDKQSVLSIIGDDGFECKNMDKDGNIDRDVVIIDWSQCNFLDEGKNIFEEIESLEVEAVDEENDFSTYIMVSGGTIFKFKETYNDRLLFTSNILVTITNELLEKLSSFIS